MTFTLMFNGTTLVNVQTATVSGNGTYTTPNGFIPLNAGTYQWSASYSGDSNNSPVAENNSPSELVTVSAATPTLSTTPNPSSVLPVESTRDLSDSAVLSGGANPTGTLTFSLSSPSFGLIVSTFVTVGGNGAYTASHIVFPSTIKGPYQWSASYSGDTNNTPVAETNSPSELVTVSAATPTLSTTPNPSSATLGPTPTVLKDSADLSAGANPTGTMTFTLFFNGTSPPVDTETATVRGNGTYSTPTGFTIPAGGTGTYQWDVSYSGDINNNPVSEINSPSERVTVSTSLSGGANLAALPSGTGYWIVHPDGGVFSYGSAPFLGSVPGLGIHVSDIVGIAATPDGGGYWLVGSDGGVFTFGDAGFFGSMGGNPLNQPVVAIAATPSVGGYYLVARDGGVFTFGDAVFAGSMGGKPLNKPVVDMAADPAGGYWLVASDGGVFTFGGAPFLGSMGGTPLVKPVVGVTSAPRGAGYWLVAQDGGVFTFGQAPFAGSLGGSALSIIGLFSTNAGAGYTLVEANGTAHAF
jgi:hypothetical protein